ncbi:hypothetical protein B4135_2844 [Caldibacillus debilis]|uniref:Uncharacterized protein n=1 Tax=Caldibacillus debilis TaxID=301148 RepID=A0A150LQ53_9BACI|nr:hypothetical protein B4135_2844 [Caldibacillus debilis]
MPSPYKHYNNGRLPGARANRDEFSSLFKFLGSEPPFPHPVSFPCLRIPSWRKPSLFGGENRETPLRNLSRNVRKILFHFKKRYGTIILFFRRESFQKWNKS